MGEPFTKYAVWLKLMTGIAKNGRMIHRHQYRNKDTSKENKPFRRLVTDLSAQAKWIGGYAASSGISHRPGSSSAVGIGLPPIRTPTHPPTHQVLLTPGLMFFMFQFYFLTRSACKRPMPLHRAVRHVAAISFTVAVGPRIYGYRVGLHH